MDEESGTDSGQALVRLSKLMAEQGLSSRREADRYIEKGWVLVDGVVVDVLGTKVAPSARITLGPAARRQQSRLTTVLLNKPVGYVSTQPEPGYTPAIALITADRQWGDGPELGRNEMRKLSVAGRLDIDSTGLLILTQDGRLASHIIGEQSTVDKEYLVRVQGHPVNRAIDLLNHGLELDGVPLKPAQVEWLNHDQLRFVLHEGRKRQIRRMCDMVGLEVIGLKRVRIGAVRLGRLPEGRWRHMGPDEYV